MRYTALISLLIMLILTTSIKSEETTTNNLLSQDFSSKWSGTATQRHGNGVVAAVNNTYIQSDDISLKDDANLTEPQLQDGFTTNHSFKYWHWNNYDSTVTSTVTITGADGEATTQIRTYSSTGCGSINCGSYQSGADTLSVSRNTQTDYDIDVRYNFTDTSNSTSHYSVDLKEPSLTVAYESEPIDQSIQDEINTIFEDLQEEIFEDMEEFTFEEETFTFSEEPQFEMEMPMEMETFTFAEEFIEDFFMEEQDFSMEDEGMAFEDGPMLTFENEEMIEEIYEESNEIVATFLPMVSQEEESFVTEDEPIFMESTENGETFQEEEMMEEKPAMAETFQEEEMMEEKPAMTETFQEEMAEEENTEMAEEEMIEEENTEMAKEEAVEEEPTKMVEATNEEKEEVKEEKSDSETPRKSAVQTKKLAQQKKIQQKKAIVKNLARIMDKVDKDIKDISKNLAIKNIIKMDAMTSEQASLNAYANTQFYKPKNIYLEQLPIFDSRLIYADKSLATYIQNDKMEIKARKLGELNLKKQRLLYELEMLKNGQT